MGRGGREKENGKGGKGEGGGGTEEGNVVPSTSMHVHTSEGKFSLISLMPYVMVTAALATAMVTISQLKGYSVLQGNKTRISLGL